MIKIRWIQESPIKINCSSPIEDIFIEEWMGPNTRWNQDKVNQLKGWKVDNFPHFGGRGSFSHFNDYISPQWN